MTADLIKALEPLTSRVRTDATYAKAATWHGWRRQEALTPERIIEHLNGGPARGCCPIKAGESTTRVGLYDLDSHKGETPWADMTVVAETLIAALERRGMHPIPFRSSGGKGIHLFLIWDEPQDAYSVRRFMADVLTEIGYANGTSGVSKKQIEIFPKQDAVASGRFGNQFILPLAGTGLSVPLDRSRGLAPLPREAAIGMEWPSSPSVPLVERPVHAPRSGSIPHDLKMVREALFSIPNDDARGGDYDWWFKILCGVKEAGGEDAREIARE
jgi:hypothetical protein